VDLLLIALVVYVAVQTVMLPFLIWRRERPVMHLLLYLLAVAEIGRAHV